MGRTEKRAGARIGQTIGAEDWRAQGERQDEWVGGHCRTNGNAELLGHDKRAGSVKKGNCHPA